MRTASGRKATPSAYRHLGVLPPAARSGSCDDAVALSLALGRCGARRAQVAREDQNDPAMSSQHARAARFAWHGRRVSRSRAAGFTFDGRAYRGSFARMTDGAIVSTRQARRVSLQRRAARDVAIVARGRAPSASDLRAHVRACSAAIRAARYDVVPSELDQVYGGVAGESPAGARGGRSTAGSVLRFGGAFARIVYSSCCGGHTEASSDAWGGAPDCISERRRPARPAPHSPYYRWTRTLAFAQIATRFSNAVQTPRDERLRSRRAIAADARGRLQLVARTAASPSRAARSDCASGRAACPACSSRRSIPARRGTGSFIEGGGLGHGVGLCQWGARGLAQRGCFVSRHPQFLFSGNRYRP